MKCNTLLYFCFFLPSFFAFGDVAHVHITGENAAGGAELSTKLTALADTDTIIEIQIDKDITLGSALPTLSNKQEVSIIGPMGAPVTINTAAFGFLSLSHVNKIICKNIDVQGTTKHSFDIAHAESFEIYNSSFTTPVVAKIFSLISLYVHSSTFSADPSTARFAFEGYGIGSVCIMESTASNILGLVRLFPLGLSFTFPASVDTLFPDSLSWDIPGLFFYKNTIKASSTSKPLLAYISGHAFFDLDQYVQTIQKNFKWKDQTEQMVEGFLPLYTSPVLWCKENAIQITDNTVYPLIVYNKYAEGELPETGLLYLKHDASATEIAIADVPMGSPPPIRTAETTISLSNENALNAVQITTTPLLMNFATGQKTVAILCDFDATNSIPALISSSPSSNEAWVICLPGSYSIPAGSSCPKNFIKISGVTKNVPSTIAIKEDNHTPFSTKCTKLCNLQMTEDTITSEITAPLVLGFTLQIKDSTLSLHRNSLFQRKPEGIDPSDQNPPSLGPMPIPYRGFVYTENFHLDHSLPDTAAIAPGLILDSFYAQMYDSQIITQGYFFSLLNITPKVNPMVKWILNLQKTWVESIALTYLNFSDVNFYLNLNGGDNTIINSLATLVALDTEHNPAAGNVIDMKFGLYTLIHGDNNAIHVGNGSNLGGLTCLHTTQSSPSMPRLINQAYSFCLAALPITHVHALPGVKYLSFLNVLSSDANVQQSFTSTYNDVPLMPFLLQTTSPLANSTLVETFSQEMFGEPHFKIGTLLQRAKYLGLTIDATPPPTKKTITPKTK